MTDHRTSPLDMAFVPKGTPMFSDLIAQLQADKNLTDTRRRDMISGLRRIAKALGRPPTDIPADAHWLQTRLAKIAPAALGLNVKSWQNAVSDARAAMAHLGIVQRRTHRSKDLSEDWQALWSCVLASKDRSLCSSLGRFVYFLDDMGVAPHAVRPEHAEAYHDAIVENEISKSPLRSYRTAVFSWNLAVKRIPEWPQITLPLASLRQVFLLPEAAFPKSFIDSLDAVLARLAQPDPLTDEVVHKPRRPATIALYRRQLLRFASEVVHSGVPIGDLTRFECLLDPAIAERGLRQMLARKGNTTSKLISRIAEILRFLGKATRQPEASQAKLARLAARLAQPAQRGMTAKNRGRLRVLQDDTTIRRLLLLPERLFAKPPTGKANVFTKALAREDAVAIAILLVCPIRIKNLAGIHLEQHLQRPGDGRVFLVLSEEEVKNERPLEFELPRDLVRMIDAHLKSRSPELCPAGTPWLFPRRDGGTGPMDPNWLSKRITKRISKETGLTVNAHLFRHLAVMIWLEANPGAYEVARRLLGHSAVSHTISMYSGLEVMTATRAFADLVDRKKGERK